MIKVWTDATEAGLLDRRVERGSTFAYLPGASPPRSVSVTMPLRLESWSVPFGLLPVFMISAMTVAPMAKPISARRTMPLMTKCLAGEAGCCSSVANEQEWAGVVYRVLHRITTF